MSCSFDFPILWTILSSQIQQGRRSHFFRGPWSCAIASCILWCSWVRIFYKKHYFCLADLPSTVRHCCWNAIFFEWLSKAWNNLKTNHVFNCFLMLWTILNYLGFLERSIHFFMAYPVGVDRKRLGLKEEPQARMHRRDDLSKFWSDMSLIVFDIFDRSLIIFDRSLIFLTWLLIALDSFWPKNWRIVDKSDWPNFFVGGSPANLSNRRPMSKASSA